VEIAGREMARDAYLYRAAHRELRLIMPRFATRYIDDIGTAADLRPSTSSDSKSRVRVGTCNRAIICRANELAFHLCRKDASRMHLGLKFDYGLSVRGDIRRAFRF
jgi:hypothetical protein